MKMNEAKLFCNKKTPCGNIEQYREAKVKRNEIKIKKTYTSVRGKVKNTLMIHFQRIHAKNFCFNNLIIA